MASVFTYDHLLGLIAAGTIDLVNDDFKIVLLDDTFTPDLSDTMLADIDDAELPAGGGYATGGQALSNVAIVPDGADIIFSFDTVEWTATGGDIGPAYYAAVYDDTHADDLLIGYIDFSGAYTALEDANFIIDTTQTAEGFFSIRKAV